MKSVLILQQERNLIKAHIALFDVRVFNPIAKVHLNLDLPTAYRRNEMKKKEHMVKLILSCFGMGKKKACFLQTTGKTP